MKVTNSFKLDIVSKSKNGKLILSGTLKNEGLEPDSYIRISLENGVIDLKIIGSERVFGMATLRKIRLGEKIEKHEEQNYTLLLECEFADKWVRAQKLNQNKELMIFNVEYI